MTRKDHKKIAGALFAARCEIDEKEFEDSQISLFDDLEYAIDFLVEMLQQDNPRFDAARFRNAARGTV